MMRCIDVTAPDSTVALEDTSESEDLAFLFALEVEAEVF